MSSGERPRTPEVHKQQADSPHQHPHCLTELGSLQTLSPWALMGWGSEDTKKKQELKSGLSLVSSKSADSGAKCSRSPLTFAGGCVPSEEQYEPRGAWRKQKHSALHIAREVDLLHLGV